MPGTAEEFYREAQRNGVIFMKGKANSVDGAHMTVSYADEMLGEDVPLAGLDLIVLATGMVPNSTDVDAPAIEPEKGAEQFADDINPVAPIKVAGYADGEGSPWPHIDKGLPPGGPILNLQYRQGPHIPILADGFSDSHYICFPYETRRTGIYAAGPVRRPMDMAQATEDATGAVMKAIQAMEDAELGRAVHPRVGDLSYPIGHSTDAPSASAAPSNARSAPSTRTKRRHPVFNEAVAAAAAPAWAPARCRRSRSTTTPAHGRRDDQGDGHARRVLGEAAHPGARLRERRLSRDRHGGHAADCYSAFVRVIPVRCLGSVTLHWITDALQCGYDGIMLMGCKSRRRLPVPLRQGLRLARERMSKVDDTLKSLRWKPSAWPSRKSRSPISARVPQLINDYAELINEMPPSPMKGF